MGIGIQARILLACLLTGAATSAHASVALLMEEPYGEFGAMNPTGHAAVYFNHICAETPTMLRPCHDGEYGVVISRYHKIDGYDWLAIPLVGYLYAVDSPNDIPVIVDKAQVAALRDAYRKKHLLALAPDDRHGRTPKGEWTELVGEPSTIGAMSGTSTSCSTTALIFPGSFLTSTCRTRFTVIFSLTSA
jgi:hypothetical protein